MHLGREVQDRWLCRETFSRSKVRRALPPPTVSLTVEVGGQPFLLHRSGGGGWASIVLPFGTQSVGPITCSDVSQCLVIASGSSGPALLEVTFQGTSGIRWRSIAVPQMFIP